MLSRTNSQALIALAAIIFSTGLAVSTPTSAQQWEPPLGIPNPPFGIGEVRGIFTHYVDNTNPLATDTGNPNGSPTTPRQTVPPSLPAGSVVEVHGGPYVLAGSRTWTGSGTAASPVFIVGVGNPVFQGTLSSIIFAGSYFIVEGFVFDSVKLRLNSPLSHFAVRNSEVRNYSPTSNSEAISINSTYTVIYKNHIHHNGDSERPTELDVHGIKPSTNASKVWIVENHIHHNGGDSIQVGDATSIEPWAEFIYIGSNEMHRDRENAVDIKQARDIIVSQNLAYDYVIRDSSGGEAIVAHNSAVRIWILFNHVHSSRIGITSTGANGFYVVGNVIHDIYHAASETAYNPGSYFGSHAILTYATTESYHIGNTIWNVDAGISYANGASKSEFINNIVGNLTQASHHIANAAGYDTGVLSHSLLGGPIRIQWRTLYTSLAGFQTAYPGNGIGVINADPQFVDVAALNYEPQAGSPVIDNGMPHSVYSTFFSLYGVDITKDIVGRPRPLGTSFDIGAYELGSGGSPTATAPPAPSNLSVR